MFFIILTFRIVLIAAWRRTRKGVNRVIQEDFSAFQPIYKSQIVAQFHFRKLKREHVGSAINPKQQTLQINSAFHIEAPTPNTHITFELMLSNEICVFILHQQLVIIFYLRDPDRDGKTIAFTLKTNGILIAIHQTVLVLIRND